MEEKISYDEAIRMTADEIAEANAALDLYAEALKKQAKKNKK